MPHIAKPALPHSLSAGDTRLSADTLKAIGQFDTCAIANAIEKLGIRLRNEGFTRPGLRCVTGGFPRLLGYAATSRVRSSDPPVSGDSYMDRTDWWADLQQLPAPRIAVIEDLSPAAGGSVVGEVHAAILKAFHCNGVVTNGAVRDLPGVIRLQFPMFAGAVTVSHSYTHLVDFGCPVEIFGLKVRAGDLLYGDCHGVISIPKEIASELPEIAAGIRVQEQRIIDFCQSADFSPEELLEIIKAAQ